jgi:hypothetical protein
MSTPANGRRGCTFVGAGHASERPRPAVSPDLINTLAGRLSARDLWLLELLHEHRVLTTGQIRELAFNTISAATHRMLTLWRLCAVERFRPAVPTGSAPLHYLLGPAGAHILARRRNLTIHQLGYRTDHTLAIATSDKLAHLTGSNSLFTALIAHARTHPGTRLEAWWSEHRCANVWGKIARPDGYGRWREHHPTTSRAANRAPNRSAGRTVDFFTEYDTGTEPLHRLIHKIGDYQTLAEMTGINHTPVLFALPNPAREQHLHTRTHTTNTTLLIATTTPNALQAAGGPAGPAWWPIATPKGTRRRLINLTRPHTPRGADAPAGHPTGDSR